MLAIHIIKFFDTYDSFNERCKANDPVGYDFLFPDEFEEKTDTMTNSISTVINEIQHETLEGDENYSMDNWNEDDEEEDLKEEINYISKDPVRKRQFDYNRSLCMANKYG